MKIIFTTLTLILISITSVFACEVEEANEELETMKAFNAMDSSDYKTAYMIWKCKAENFDHNAMLNLGGMYTKGQYVSQNDIKATMWYFLAGKNGNETAQIIYDANILFKSSGWVSKVKNAVEECLDKKYKDCF